MDPSRSVSSLMQKEFVSLRSTDRLDLAEHIMRLGRVRHLPVIDEGRLVGILSNRDLLAAALSKALAFETTQRSTFLRSVDVSEVMTRDVVAVSPDTPLSEAARRMIAGKIGCLPVTREHRVMVGLLTETDLLKAAYLDLPDDEIVCDAVEEEGSEASRGAVS